MGVAGRSQRKARTRRGCISSTAWHGLTSVGFAHDDRELGNGGLGVGIEELRPVADDPSMFLRDNMHHHRTSKLKTFILRFGGMQASTWSVPGRNPGTSTKVIMGMLKLSRNRTNLNSE